MKTMADVLRERGKLGPYTTEEPEDGSPVVPAEDPPPRRRARKREPELPPVDF